MEKLRDIITYPMRMNALKKARSAGHRMDVSFVAPDVYLYHPKGYNSTLEDWQEVAIEYFNASEHFGVNEPEIEAK